PRVAVRGWTVLGPRSESYVSPATALLMVTVGAWMLIGNWWRADPEHEHEHRHDLGVSHSHNESLSMAARPSWGLLFGLGLAGGLLPDPAALAVLLAALASGKLVLGLLT